MNKPKKEKQENIKLSYFKAFLVGALIAALAVLTMSIYVRISIEEDLYLTKEQQNKVERKFTESILSQEDILNKLYSDDYKFNIYMGNLHMSVGEFPEAETYYKNATYLAPDATYEHYLRLIVLYLRTDRPEKAEEIEQSVVDKNSQRLIKFKCRANLYLADYYYHKNNGKASNKKYKLASYYFDKLNIRKVKSREYIEKGLLASYVQIADEYVENKNYLEAYRYLKRAESIDFDNLTVKYKLALVLSYINPMMSIEYYDLIKKHKPQMLSFYLYYEALMRAAEISNVRGDYPSGKLYAYKAGSIKNFYENNIVNPEVIRLDFLHSKIQTSKVFDKFTIKFRLSNITTHILDNVKVDIIFYRKDKPLAKFTKTILDKEKPLRPNETTPIITVNYDTPEHLKRNVYEEVYFEIYLYSNEKYKSLMYKGDFAQSLMTEM